MNVFTVKPFFLKLHKESQLSDCKTDLFFYTTATPQKKDVKLVLYNASVVCQN
jgi:hypothetical protein